MKYKFTKIILLTAVVAGLTTACTPAGENTPTGKRYEFNNILDIAYTPDTLTRCGGWFTDAGSWMGFTLPQKDHWVNGFCGPFSLDMNRRQWMAQSAVTVGITMMQMQYSLRTPPVIFPVSYISRQVQRKVKSFNA